MRRDREHYEAIIGGLRAEGEERVAAVSCQLAQQLQGVVGQEAAKRSELEARLEAVEVRCTLYRERAGNLKLSRCIKPQMAHG